MLTFLPILGGGRGGGCYFGQFVIVEEEIQSSEEKTKNASGQKFLDSEPILPNFRCSQNPFLGQILGSA